MRDLVKTVVNCYWGLDVAVSNQRDAAAQATMAFAKICAISSREESPAFDQIKELADESIRSLATMDLSVCKNTEDLHLKVHLAAETALVEANYEVHLLHDPKVREQVWALTDGKCAYCDCDLGTKDSKLATFAIEHVIPRHSGGPDHIANYVPACIGCNSAKGREHVLHFIKKHVSKRVALTAFERAVAAAQMSEAAE